MTPDIARFSLTTYSRQYMPARTAWNGGEGRSSPHPTSPLNPTRPVAELGGPDVSGPSSRADNNNYYEDIDPRFAGQPVPNQQPPQVDPGYDDVRAVAGGARSPTGSERSNFTSISQRGVNPHWNPPPPMPNQYGPPRRPVQQRQDMILDNPDFQVPGRRPGGGGPRGGPGMVPGSAYPTGAL